MNKHLAALLTLEKVVHNSVWRIWCLPLDWRTSWTCVMRDIAVGNQADLTLFLFCRGWKGRGQSLLMMTWACNPTLRLFGSEGGGEGRAAPSEDCICKQIRERGRPPLTSHLVVKSLCSPLCDLWTKESSFATLTRRANVGENESHLSIPTLPQGCPSQKMKLTGCFGVFFSPK